MKSVSLAAVLAIAGMTSCKKAPPPPPPPELEPAPAALSSSPAPRAVAEVLPRCRAVGRELVLPGEDVVVGDAVLATGALYVGVIRREGAKRSGAVLKLSLDLSASSTVEVGTAMGEDPPPSPRVAGAEVFVAFYMNQREAGAIGTPGASRELAVGKLDAARPKSVVQQADESTAFDVAFGAEGPPVVAWDEDAPIPAGQFLADRGQIRVQLLGESEKPRVASPFASDAESPKLALRQGGYWLAWLARKLENPDAGSGIEGPGEDRAYRRIEVVPLDDKANPVGPVRRLSPEKARVVSFELQASAAGSSLVVLAQDEAAEAEGAGARVVRYEVAAAKDEKPMGTTLLEGGLGHAIAELVPPWLAWTDATEHAHLLPLSVGLGASGAGTREPALDGSRVIAASSDQIWAVFPGPNGRVVLRTLACAKKP